MLVHKVCPLTAYDILADDFEDEHLLKKGVYPK